jgi:hypothetical protein
VTNGQAWAVRAFAMTEPLPLIHIGYHKTGSSWLQTIFFGMSRDYARPGKTTGLQPGSFVSPWSRSDIVRVLVGEDPLSFDPDAARRFFASAIESATRASLLPVVSHERLSGLPNLGGHDSKEIADRLACVFPSGRVLIVIREQASVITSYWKTYVERGGIRPVGKYVTQLMARGAGTMSPPARHYRYHQLIAYYRGLFGDDNVCVLPFELLVKDRDGFVGQIAAFAGTKAPTEIRASIVNPSLSRPAVAAKRWLNLAIPTDIDLFPPSRLNGRLLRGISRMDRLVPMSLSKSWDGRLSRVVKIALGDYFASSNRTTGRLIGVCLASYGYRC